MKSWKQIVGTVAPTLATALGGPIAGMAVKAISNQVLGKPDASEAEVEQAILGGDPQTLLKLKEVEVEFKQSLLTAGIELEKIAAADRDSARRREVDSHDTFTPRTLAFSIVGLTLLLEGYVMIFGLPKTGIDPVIVGRILGTLDALSTAVVMYYFGSSASSKAKDATISDIAKSE